jgi:TolA-binding protein
MIERRSQIPHLILLAILAIAGPRLAAPAFGEVDLSSQERKRLDTFENHTLTQADKAFSEKKWDLAAKSYDAFILEFPRSMALPYALLRKGRALHESGKRYEAIKQYQEVLDYFPNAVSYAAAALYRQGEAYWQSGDVEDALKKWATMAKDKDYSRQPVAAAGMVKLADQRLKDGQTQQAIEYYTQIAVNFRKSREDKTRRAVNNAIDQVVFHHVHRDPNQEKLAALYQAVDSFHHHPRKTADDLEKDEEYWETVRHLVWRHNRFEELEADQEKRFYQYWADQFEGRFPASDKFQTNAFQFQLRADGDTAAWKQRLDSHYQKYQKSGDYARTVRWIDHFGQHKDKWTEYYRKLDFAEMEPKVVWELVTVLFNIDEPDMAANAFDKLDLSKVSDDDKRSWAWWVANRDMALAERVCAGFNDTPLGKMTLLEIYDRHKRSEEGIPIAEELRRNDRFASKATWILGEMLMREKRYQEAIAVFQQVDNPPDNLKRIVDCYVALKELEKAVGLLREIENFFEKDAAWASYKAAQLFRRFDRKEQYVAELRQIMKKYPGTGQASNAHNELEEMGIRIGLGEKD